MLPRLRSWVRNIFGRSAMEGELDAELRFHLEARTGDLVAAGVPRSDAARRARLEFGAPEA